MKWRKLGKIFDPAEHTSSGNFEFAQSPQTLVFDNFIRIYFSTREKDTTGQYLSHIAFIDFDKNLSTVINTSKKTVISLGNLGCFDEHGIFPINPVRIGNKIFAYTCGWSRRISVPVETSIGLAVSNDNGLTFQKMGEGPIMSSSLHEPFLVGDAFVKQFNDTYHMWYIYGIKWKEEPSEPSAARVYKIAHATSSDGINWTRESKPIVTDRLNDDECQALPTVIEHNNKYHMYFCYRESTGFRNDKNRGYKIGYAYSTDLIRWQRDNDNPSINVSDNDWDSDMQCYPHLFSCDGKIYLLYNGNEFGRFGFGAAVLETD